MILKIENPEFMETSGIERGMYHFGLSDYPNITTLELCCMLAFIKYENMYSRRTEIICDDEKILAVVNDAIANPDTVETIPLPETTEFVYHATNIYATQKILSSGSLLSAAKVYGKTRDELAFEKQNSPWNDPADYFEYIMFCNGDDMTGDYVVLSENFPGEENLEKGNFDAGIRFYIRSEDILRHPGYIRWLSSCKSKRRDSISRLSSFLYCTGTVQK